MNCAHIIFFAGVGPAGAEVDNLDGNANDISSDIQDMF